MYIEGVAMDDILNKLYKLIQVEGKPVDNGKGTNKEILGVYIRLLNPLSRVSRSFTRGLPISPLGELFWYLSGSDQLEFIKYYLNDYQNFSDDGKTLYGAYGKRLFHKNEKINQIDFIV